MSRVQEQPTILQHEPKHAREGMYRLWPRSYVVFSDIVWGEKPANVHLKKRNMDTVRPKPKRQKVSSNPPSVGSLWDGRRKATSYRKG